MTIGQAIRALRKKRGLTQNQLGRSVAPAAAP